MNVDHIYRFQRDEAFAKQFTAPSYTTFVAMPYGRTEGYDADDIYLHLKEKVHLRANDLGTRVAKTIRSSGAGLRA